MYAQASYAQTSTEDTMKVEPPHGLSELQAYYLFYSKFSKNKYKGALKYGRWILKDMPRKIKNYSAYDLPTNMDRFVTIYSKLAEDANDPTVKSAYVDTVNMIYDKVFNTFSEDEIDAYQWHINRGRFDQKYSDFIDDADAKTIDQYLKAFKLKPDKMTEGKGYYLRVLLKDLVSKDTPESKKQAMAIIKKVDGHVNNEKLEKYIDGVRKHLFTNPSQRIAYLQKKLKKNPKDEDALKKLRDLYKRQDKTQEVEKINEKLYQIDPNYQNAANLANYAIKNGNSDKAIKYLEKAQSQTDDQSKLKVIYLNLARAYMNKGTLTSARKYAKKAIHIDPDLGKAYILTADIYAKAVSKCTANRELDKSDRAVYWLVLDYLEKAKKVDPSVKSTADSQLESYRPAAPTKEDIFFNSNWKKGKKIQINGSLNKCYSWINESTTVRAVQQ
jgi:tetratricopeptide (TPR) repeat protein